METIGDVYMVLGRVLDRIQSRATNPQREIKSSFLMVWICTTSQKIPARPSTNHGAQKGDLIIGGDDWGRLHGAGWGAKRLPSLRGRRKGLFLS